MEWINLALGMYHWAAVMNNEMNLAEVEIFLDQQSDYYLHFVWCNGQLKSRLSHC